MIKALYHLFSNATLAAVQKPIMVMMLITHFSNIVPRNCWIIPINDTGKSRINNAETAMPQNLLNFTGIIWLANKVMIMPGIMIKIEEDEIC